MAMLRQRWSDCGDERNRKKKGSSSSRSSRSKRIANGSVINVVSNVVSRSVVSSRRRRRRRHWRLLLLRSVFPSLCCGGCGCASAVRSRFFPSPVAATTDCCRDGEEGLGGKGGVAGGKELQERWMQDKL